MEDPQPKAAFGRTASNEHLYQGAEAEQSGPKKRTVSITDPPTQTPPEEGHIKHTRDPSFSEYPSSEKQPLIPPKRNPSASILKMKKGSFWVPTLMTFLVAQGTLLFGINIGFSSPTNTSIQMELGLNKSQVGLLWSWVNVGAMFGCLSAAPIAERIGRKRALILMSVPFIAGAGLFLFVIDYYVMSTARLITGVGVGMASVLVPLYIAEASPTHLRGALGSVNQFMICLGIVLINAIGLPIVDQVDWWKWMVFISSIPVAIILIGMFTVGVETPRWLLSKGKDEEAEKSLRFLRGNDFDVAGEIADLKQSSGNGDQEANNGVDSNGQMSFVEKIKYLFGTRAIKPLLIGIMLQLLQQWCGINAVMFHTSELFVPEGSESRDDRLNALKGSIIVNFAQVFMCGVAVLSMHRAGRRFFMITSQLGMGLFGILMGFAFQKEWSTVWRMVFVMMYVAFFALGAGPIPWLVCAEIFPSRVRELAMSISTLISWSCSFAVTAAMFPLQDIIGPQGVFWVFSGVSLTGVVLCYFFMPETKDKSLEEIEHELIGSD